MNLKNYEFKAKVNSLEGYIKQLLKLNPTNIGTEHQVDTYFDTLKGRLKLREIDGKESKLIDYKRENTSDSKKSDILLYKHESSASLKNILSNQFNIKTIVDKRRIIYEIENVRFHFDNVENLGTFIEVEAIDENEDYTIEELKKQCDYYYAFFKIQPDQVIIFSYSDLIFELKKNLLKNISFSFDASYFDAGSYSKATGNGKDVTYLSFKSTFKF